METKQSNVPAVRLHEAELQTLGVPYSLVDRYGPQCGAGAVVLVIVMVEERLEPVGA